MKQFITIGLLLGLLLATLSACARVTTNTSSDFNSSSRYYVYSPYRVPNPAIITSSSRISSARATNPVYVSITGTTITSSPRTFSSARTYTFFVTDRSSHAQNFIIVPRPSLSQPVQGALLILPSTILRPGKTIVFTYKFPPIAVHNRMEITNHLEGAAGSGIYQLISVT
jgi:hypothetical protein